jgi:hypothetical protein
MEVPVSLLLATLCILAFVALAILTGSGDEIPSDSRRRMRARMSRGGFPPESWEIY